MAHSPRQRPRRAPARGDAPSHRRQRVISHPRRCWRHRGLSAEPAARGGASDAADEWTIFTNRETCDLVPAAPNFTEARQPVRARSRPWRILWEQTGLPLAAARCGIDVMLNPGFTCPLAAPCPNVTVFHDLQHKRHPEYFRWFDLPAWQFLLWAAAHRSRSLIAVSEATRADLRRYYGVDASVIYHGVEPELFDIAERREPQRTRSGLSTLHPHKNLERLVRAWAKLGRARLPPGDRRNARLLTRLRLKRSSRRLICANRCGLPGGCRAPMCWSCCAPPGA